MMWTKTMLRTIDFAVAVPTPTGPPPGGVPVVTADQHDRGRHHHALDQAEDQVGRVLEHPEDQQVAAGGDVADLLDDGEVAGQVHDPDPDQVHEREGDPGGEQAGRAEEGDRRHAHHLERVDLVGDPHRPELGDDPGPDLGRQHVAEGVGHDLAQVAPGGEDAGVGGRALGAEQVGALDPALQAEGEDEAPDDQRRAEDQDPGLAQALAEEAEDAAGVDEAGDAGAEAGDLPRRVEPAARDREPGVHRIVCSSGLVASRVWVKT